MGEDQGSIANAHGHLLELREIEQWSVYEGAPGGQLPPGAYDQVLAAALDGADRRPATLIRPPGIEAGAALPRIGARARFTSDRPAQGTGEFSELTVVWFQHTWALPIDPGVLESLAALDWPALARDMVW